MKKPNKGYRGSGHPGKTPVRPAMTVSEALERAEEVRRQTEESRQAALAPIEPRFTFPTQQAARQYANSRCRHAGMDKAALSTITDGKLWAVVPRHLGPDDAPPAPEPGTRVRDITQPDRCGVYGVGVVKWDDGSSEAPLTTYYLQPTDKPPVAAPVPVKRERLGAMRKELIRKVTPKKKGAR